MPTNKIQTLLARDAKQMLPDIGHVATWEGTEYDCFLVDPDVSIDLQEGGFLPEGLFTLKFLRADFNDGAGPFPQDNDRITYDGEVYKVTAAVNKAESAHIKLSIAP